MTHRLLDPRRKQPRRAPGADPNPLGPDPQDHRQHPEPPRPPTTPHTPHVVVAGRTPGKARLPPSGTPPEQPQGRRQGRLPQRGGHPMPHEPVERRRVRHRPQAPSGPPLGGTGQQVLQPPIVLPQILLHPQARQQRWLGQLLGRVLGPIGGQVRTGNLQSQLGKPQPLRRFHGDSSLPGPHPSSSNSITPRGFRRSTGRIYGGSRGGSLRGGSGPRDGRPDGRSRPDRRTGEPLLLRPAHAMDAVCPRPERRTRRGWAGPCPELLYRCTPGVRVFQGPGSVFGARCSALGVGPAPVPGTRSQVPDSRYPIPGTRYLSSKNTHTGYAPGVWTVEFPPFGSRSEQRMTVTLRRP